MKKFLIILFTLWISSTWADNAPNPPAWGPKRLIVFGDGFSDIGNKYSLYKEPVSPPYWHGRYSNGPIWAEQLAYNYHLIPDPTANPFYSSTDNFQDYAFGDAVLVAHNEVKGVPTKTLDAQIALYMNHHSKEAENKNALAVFWIGTNDLLNPDCYKKPFQCVNAMVTDQEN